VVTNIAATTITTNSPTISPSRRLLDAVCVPIRPWTTAGPTSPEPLTTTDRPEW
jgi:hypothetical protein